MQPDIANVVHPVFTHGLRLKQLAEAGEAFEIDQEQAALKKLLLGDQEARRWPDYCGEFGSQDALPGPSGSAPVRRWDEQFLGIRYLLVCWLDDILIDSPRGTEWGQRKLEAALYGTDVRAEAFWEQARRADGRVGIDASEVCFLCVMLGFRGKLRNHPEQLREWVNRVQQRVAKGQGQECPFPAELDAPIHVPPRRGRERLQRAALWWAAALLVLVPAAVFFGLWRTYHGP